MDKKQLKKILNRYRQGKCSLNEAIEEFEHFPFQDMGFAKIDTHRALRQGVPEVVYCQGKSFEHIQRIFLAAKPGHYIMGTRANEEIFKKLKKSRGDLVFLKEAGIIVGGKFKRYTRKKIIVVSAGTADIPVAQEAAVTAQVLGNPVETLFDVGVAGVHRLLMNRRKILKANVVIVVAGMEGALASIVGGLVSRPVVAVPTSVGYGASFKGIAPLLTMLNSCAPGIAVVNIDNGFGAGYLASMINQLK